MVDLLLCCLLGIPWVVLMFVIAVYVQEPVIMQTIMNLGEMQIETEDDLPPELTVSIFRLTAKNRPELVPQSVHEALASNDMDVVMEAIKAESLSYGFSVNFPPRRSFVDLHEKHIHVRQDVVLGPLTSVLGWAAFVVLYFTLFPRLFRGRTPGKWMFGIVVRRLDGRPLTLLDCFGRAGGYSASLSTFGLGFYEAFWSPNRQALHDKIIGSVVVRRSGPQASPETTSQP